MTEISLTDEQVCKIADFFGMKYNPRHMTFTARYIRECYNPWEIINKLTSGKYGNIDVCFAGKEYPDDRPKVCITKWVRNNEILEIDGIYHGYGETNNKALPIALINFLEGNDARQIDG